jgi:hypothetical protein
MKRVNRKKLPKWTRALSAAEIKHLANDAGGLSLRVLRATLASQERGDCWTCWGIGKKLGFGYRVCRDENTILETMFLTEALEKFAGTGAKPFETIYLDRLESGQPVETLKIKHYELCANII